MKKDYICVYDSGVGGLTTLSEIIKLLPNENYLYFADNKNCPYGNKTTEEITSLVLKNIDKLTELYDIKMLVFGCNTITAACVEQVRNKYSFPVVGIEPAVKLALKNSETKSVVAIMTNATMNQEKYKNLIKRQEGSVVTLPLSNFAKEIEENKMQGKEIDLTYYVKMIKACLEENNSDALVLGCTHYVYFEKELEERLTINVYNGNLGIAKRVKDLLLGKINGKKRGKVKIKLTKKGFNQKKKYKNLLKTLKI